MVRKKLLFVTATTAIALFSGFMFRSDAGTSITEAPDTGAGTFPESTMVAVAVMQQAPAETKPAELEQTEPEPKKKLLESAGLDAETQWSIYDECGCNAQLFCTVMAIAEKETGYDTNAIGDGGKSIGMLQINTPWHSKRMETLGITDLTDPVQSARVAVSILTELTDTYGFETATHSQFMGYNMGPKGAKKAMDGGYNSTEYSQEVMQIYQGYLKEMEVED